VTDRKDETPIFKADANATPVSEIKPPAPDPRRARVSRVHAEIAEGVKDGSIYRPR
jgi:hypothetical protein